MIDLKKRSNILGRTPDSKYFTRRWVNNARAIFPLVFNLALFLQRKFLLALLSHVIFGCHPVSQTSKTVLNVAKLRSRELSKVRTIFQSSLMKMYSVLGRIFLQFFPLRSLLISPSGIWNLSVHGWQSQIKVNVDP